jgi:hypothetical protein
MVGAANATETAQIAARMNKTVFRFSRSMATLGKTIPHNRLSEMTIRLKDPDKKNVTENQSKCNEWDDFTCKQSWSACLRRERKVANFPYETF